MRNEVLEVVDVRRYGDGEEEGFGLHAREWTPLILAPAVRMIIGGFLVL
jgi:hypothetical protein